MCCLQRNVKLTNPKHWSSGRQRSYGMRNCLNGHVVMSVGDVDLPVSLTRDESTESSAGSTSDIRKPCLGGDAVVQPANYHAQAILHICLLPPYLAQTLACSLILSRIDYCNALMRSNQHHPEAETCAEQCCPSRPADNETSLATDQAARQIQACSADYIKLLPRRHVPQPSLHVTCVQNLRSLSS